MSKDEVRRTVAEFGTAAKNALEAGFDGVQIQANYLYLIAQFLNSATNLPKMNTAAQPFIELVSSSKSSRRCSNT